MNRATRDRINILLMLAPALGLIIALFGASVVYGVLQSFGYLTLIDQQMLSLAAYRNVLIGPSVAASEFWPALGFSLWVSGASTFLAALGALLLVLLPGQRQRDASKNNSSSALYLSLAFPHLVWAIGLSLLLAQSGLLARVATALGLMTAPADFPVLVRDRFGFGIILDYVTKEIPFLALIMLAILRSQPEGYDLVAENLGATRWQRLRYVTLPLVMPGLIAGSLLIFAFVFGAYEVPALLGVRFPRMLAVLSLEFFLNSDLRNRAEGMAISIIMALIVLLIAGVARYISVKRVA
jgi:putative spermidine/putrescine transport system permease protein